MKIRFCFTAFRFAKAMLVTILFAIFLRSIFVKDSTINHLIRSRIKDSLAALVEQNETIVYDWASWDETVDLVNGNNDEYFDDNFNQDTSRIFQIAVVVDNKDFPVAGQIWNEKSDSFESLKVNHIEYIYSQLNECGTSSSVELSANYLFSSSPITATSQRSGNQTYGCLYFGTLLPDPKLNTIIADLENNPSLHIQNILITSNGHMLDSISSSSHALLVEGKEIGLFGSNILIFKYKFPLMSYKLLLSLVYLTLMGITLMKKGVVSD